MALKDHDRLDKILHTEEFIEMRCGSLGYVLMETARAYWSEQRMIERDEATGQLRTERKYCGPDCPTLRAHILSQVSVEKEEDTVPPWLRQESVGTKP
jgi:hypothetical protein